MVLYFSCDYLYMFDMYYVNQTVRVVRQWSDSLTPYRSQSSSLYVVLCHGYSKEYTFAFKYRTISKFSGFILILASTQETLTLLHVNSKDAGQPAHLQSEQHPSGLQIRVHTRKLFFLFLNQNICCGCSKGPSR